MVALPEYESPTVKAIYKAYEERDAKQMPRGHLGASLIGEECSRKLWYVFRWCGRANFSGRMLRLFETGQREEARVVANLRAIGVTVHEVDPSTRKQFRYSAHGGHFGGSLDGAVQAIPEAPKRWHLLEIKTHNAKSFKALKNKGVMATKPTHFHQMQTYMGMAGLERALYFAVQKDTDELYVERIKFERPVHDANIKKALRVIQSPEPLTKISDNPDAFACKWCDHHAVCHDDKIPPTNCRTCLHSTPNTNGEGARWHCDRHNKNLTLVEQHKGCDEHLYIPALIPYAEPADAGDDWVSYQMKDRDQIFVNCAATGFPAIDAPHFSSQELHAVAPAVIGNAAVESVRKTLGGTIVATSEEGSTP